MAVPITSFLSKASAAIPFLLRDSDLRGGYRVVTTVEDRDAVAIGARTVGMMVFVSNDAAFFQWDGSLWQPLDVTSMVNVGTGLSSDGTTLTVDQTHLDTLYAPVNHDHAGVYATADHNHDTAYAAAGHDHAGVYAPATHNHDEDYAPALHNHDGDYAPATHDHDTQYSAINHNHDTQYAATDHTHTEFAAASHTHDGQYAAVSHAHTFASLTEVPKVSAMPGVTISTVEPAPTDGEDGDIWFVVAL